MERADLLLQGALDLHAHGYPEFTTRMPPRVDNTTWAELAVAASMRGFVMKSHIWPTTAAVHMLRSMFPTLETYSSITLNPPVGGLNPLSVEIAASSGARIVWMPTWSARSDGPPKPSVYLDRMRPYLRSLDVEKAQGRDGLSVLDGHGNLSADVVTILEICREHDMTVASGHLPIRSSLLLAHRASELGVRFILTHPLSGSVGASIEDQREVAGCGGFIEHVFIGCMPMHQRSDPARIVEAIEAVGPEHCVLSSDAIEAWNPPPPEVLRMYIASLLALGVDEDAVYLMTHDNPARALGLSAPSDRQVVDHA
jgi:uncharacterized protein DUF6282